MTESNNTSTSTWVFIRKVLIRAIIFFILFNLLFIRFDLGNKLGEVSLYDRFYPGRERLPFGENSRISYNLSLYNVDAMINSHKLSANEDKPDDEFRVVVIGDSSIWGTLLKPEETFSSLLNDKNLKTQDNQKVVFYNLGYPSMSVTKDLIFVNEALKFSPDLIIWAITLESLPAIQDEVPLVKENHDLLNELGLSLLKTSEESTSLNTLLEKSIFGQRRALANLVRLQVYGFMWGATGIDQEYPEFYPPAARDLINDAQYKEFTSESFNENDLRFNVLLLGSELAGEIPIVFINEPILISHGENSDIRYNFLYPQWAYDIYREMMDKFMKDNNLSYFDLWDAVPESEFTNSAVHLSPDGEMIFVENFLEKTKNLFK